MTAKDWLSQGKYIGKEICALREAMEKAKHLPVENQSTASYLNILDQKIAELTKTNSDIISAIYGVENNLLRALLIERFINHHTWETVSLKLGYDFYHVIKRLYPKAVAEIEKSQNFLH